MKEESYTSTPPMGRTACTEPQCLYKGALYVYFYYYIYKDVYSISGAAWCVKPEEVNPLNAELNPIC